MVELDKHHSDRKGNSRYRMVRSHLMERVYYLQDVPGRGVVSTCPSGTRVTDWAASVVYCYLDDGE